MSLLGVIQRFRTPGLATSGTYTVNRTLPGDYPSGEYVPGTASTFTIVASVQPLTGRETVVLPEGVRTEDVRQLWTSTELRVHDDNADADVVVIPGGLSAPAENFNVIGIEGPWTMGGRTHYHVFVARRKRP